MKHGLHEAPEDIAARANDLDPPSEISELVSVES